MNANQLSPQDRLKQMLGGAKQIMNKVESGDYSPGNIDPSMLEVNGTTLLEAHAVPQQFQQQPQQQYNQQAAYANSKLPAAIKEAMANTPPMPIWNPHHTFDLADVAELVEKPIPTPQYRQPAPQQQQMQQPNQQLLEQQFNQQFQQQYQQPAPAAVPAGMMMVSEAQLKQMMKDYMMDFMANTFTKSLSEEVIKKTIGTLIKEGKITVKSTPAQKK